MSGKVDHPIAPYLCVNDGERAIAFYKEAFGAVERLRLGAPGQRIGHAELLINGALIMLSDEFPDMDVRSAATLGGSPVVVCLTVDDVDQVAQRAVAAGAKVLRPVADQFYGDRGGKFQDPFGHVWWIATHIEDLSPEEIQRRAEALYGS